MPTLWGCAWKLSGEELPNPDVVEIDFRSWSEVRGPRKRKPALSLSVPAWLFQAKGEFEDRLESVTETLRDSHAEACVITLPSRLANQRPEELRQTCLEVRERLEKQCSSKIWFDFGRTGPPASLPREWCVSDPFWHADPTFGTYWKIHGWHEERWVRMYSADQLKSLIKQAARKRPEYVVLAHSSRALQLEQVREL